ncbi:MAG: PAS domain-containing sensor histidine kinase [Candidatus Humimicrobiaceae bacterium]
MGNTEKNYIEKLKDSIRIQNKILDGIPILQYSISQDGVLSDCNTIAIKTLGYKNKKELIGKPFVSTLFAPSSIKKAQKLFLKLKKTGILKNEELQIKTSKDTVINVNLNAYTLDKKEKTHSFIITQIEVDRGEKKETEIDDMSNFPIENPNPIFRISDKLKIIYANEPGYNVLSKLGLKGKRISKKFSEQVIPLLKKKNDNVMTLELRAGTSVYKFSIVKSLEHDYYNIYGNDITDIKKEEKSEKYIYKKTILLNDRNYIARELHDTVTQTLFSANLIAEVLPRLWKKDPKGVMKRLDEVRMLNNIALTEMRALLFDLRPSSFKTEELKDLLKELVKSISRKSKIPISVDLIKKYQYSHRIELSFYRIAQESLNNIAKHSCASKASLTLKSLPDKILMDIEDDGIGFNPEDVAPENLGLLIMRERVKMIGASLNLDSRPGRTKISVVYNNNKNTKKNNYGRKKSD